jgi:hypothetical protein
MSEALPKHRGQLQNNWCYSNDISTFGSFGFLEGLDDLLFANCREKKLILLDDELLGFLFYSIQWIPGELVLDNAFSDLLNLGHKKCVKNLSDASKELSPTPPHL